MMGMNFLHNLLVKLPYFLWEKTEKQKGREKNELMTHKINILITFYAKEH